MKKYLLLGTLFLGLNAGYAKLPINNQNQPEFLKENLVRIEKLKQQDQYKKKINESANKIKKYLSDEVFTRKEQFDVYQSLKQAKDLESKLNIPNKESKIDENLSNLYTSLEKDMKNKNSHAVKTTLVKQGYTANVGDFYRAENDFPLIVLAIIAYGSFVIAGTFSNGGIDMKV